MILKASDSLYTGRLDAIDVSIFSRMVTARNIVISVDSQRLKALIATHQAPKMVANLKIGEMQVSSIAWQELLGDKEIVAGRLQLNNPIIKLVQLPADSLQQTDTAKKKPGIERVHFGKVVVAGLNADYSKTAPSGEQILHARNAHIELIDWNMEPGKKPDTSNFLFAKNGNITADSFWIETPGSLYNMSVGTITFNSEKQNAIIKKFKLKAALSHEEMYKEIGHQKDIFNITIPEMAVESFNWQQLLANRTLRIGEVVLKKPVLSDYFSRYPPPNPESKIGNFPQQMLMKLKLPIMVKKVLVQQGTFTYTEVNTKSGKAGKINFSGVNGTVSNITNVESELQHNSHATIQLQGTFMGQTPISATFDLNIPDPEAAFSVTGKMGKVTAAQIREPVEALALAKVNSWEINSVDLKVEGNQRAAHGFLKMPYQNLDITLQKAEVEDGKKKVKNRGLLSFAANELLVFDNNPKKAGEELRTATSAMPRDIYKSFFSLIWKNILTGIIKTVMRSDNIADVFAEKQQKGNDDREKEMKEKKKEKKKKKKGFFKRIF